MTEAQAATTRFAARVVGPLFLIIGAIVVIRFEALMVMMPAILQDGALVFITGIFTLIAGLVLFAAHHHWSSAAAIALSLIGLLTIVRGALLMLAPDLVASVATNLMHAAPFAWIAGAIAIVIGAWLTFVGWFVKSV